MSVIAAITANVVRIVGAVEPETKLSAARFRFVAWGGLHEEYDKLRHFTVEPLGGVSWDNVYTQDREGSVVREDLALVIHYPSADAGVRLDTVIRQDVLRIQYELLAPDNWPPELRWQRTTTGAYAITGGPSETAVVRVPFTLTYRPF